MIEIDKNELGKMGIQFGDVRRRWNPQMKPYIYQHQRKNKVDILDLQKITNSCRELPNYVKPFIEKKKTILFLSTKEEAREIVKEQAQRCGMPYIVNKWKGGFITNFPEIVRKLKELKGIGNFLQKTSMIKKVRTSYEKRKNKLKSVYEGVVDLKVWPDVLFIIGLNRNGTALREAKKRNIPIIAVCNTNCDPRLVDYALPGNDENPKSIAFFANLMAEAIIQARTEKDLTKEQKEEKETEVKSNNSKEEE